MRYGLTARRIFTTMLACVFGIGLLIVVQALYQYSIGGRPIHENGLVSHGIYRRFTGLLLLAHVAILFLVALRLRQPRWSLIWLYPISVATLIGGGLIGLDIAWKAGGDFGAALGFLAVPMAVSAIAVTFGTENRKTDRIV